MRSTKYYFRTLFTWATITISIYSIVELFAPAKYSFMERKNKDPDFQVEIKSTSSSTDRPLRQSSQNSWRDYQRYKTDSAVDSQLHESSNWSEETSLFWQLYEQTADEKNHQEAENRAWKIEHTADLFQSHLREILDSGFTEKLLIFECPKEVDNGKDFTPRLTVKHELIRKIQADGLDGIADTAYKSKIVINQIEVQLLDPSTDTAFQIKALKDISTSVIRIEDLSWVWAVKPYRGGAQALQINISAPITIDGQLCKGYQNSFVWSPINVRMTLADKVLRFFSRPLGWISSGTAAAVIALIGLFSAPAKKFRARRLRRRIERLRTPPGLAGRNQKR